MQRANIKILEDMDALGATQVFSSIFRYLLKKFGHLVEKKLNNCSSSSNKEKKKSFMGPSCP